MVGIFFQSSFIIASVAYLLYLDTQPTFTKELLANTILSFLVFSFWQKKKFKSFDSYFFALASLTLILYSAITATIFLPDSQVARQKLYLRFVFYLSSGVFYWLLYKEIDKKILLLYAILASSHIYFFRYHYTSIAILLYLIANLHLLKEIKMAKGNFFDLFSVALLASILVSTIYSFFYNGSYSTYGTFHFFSGFLIYLFFKLLDQKQILKTLFISQFFYLICLILYSMFIVLYFFYNDFQPNFSLRIGGFHVSNIGSMILVNLPTTIGLYLLQPSEKKQKLIYLFIVFLSLVVLYFTHSRASILGVIIGCTTLFFVYVKLSPDRKGKLLPIFTFFFLFALVFLGKKIIDSDVFNTNSLSARKSIWEAYIERVIHHSLLFGFGSNNEFFHSFLPIQELSPQVIGDLKFYFQNFQAFPHAHNLYLQIFFNYGSVGFAIMIMMIIYTATKAWKMFRNKSISPSEGIALAILSSLFFQEIFDYTMIDAMTFYQAILAIGILSHPFQAKEGNNQKPLSFPPKYLVAIQIVLMVFIILLGFNLCLSEKIKLLFRNQFTIDNFSNLKFKDGVADNQILISRFMTIDPLFLPLPIDEKKEQFAGQVYLEIFHKSKDRLFLEKASGHFQSCIRIFPYSAVCLKRLSEIESLKGDAKNAKDFESLYKQNDPFGLVVP
ncbi:O-antigen ligase family protein [Leptospira ryugenii]|uniref:O-antigen ligase family protein n=1 Tax=Leptospira ryugenii TaxID=1917863 RepID=UPI000D592C0B|nr:O-antigen ligase family protein [Leptospira ryugenii]